MDQTRAATRRQVFAATSVMAAALVMAIVVAMSPDPGSTYNDPNTFDFQITSFQDALDVAMLKCALGRPDCVGTTATSAGSVTVALDGDNYQLTIQIPGGLPPITSDKIKGKAMQRFQDAMALANSLAPGPDPNAAIGAISDHTDPNNPSIRVTATLSFKVRTADGRKGVMTVSVSPSLAVRWNLQLK